MGSFLENIHNTVSKLAVHKKPVMAEALSQSGIPTSQYDTSSTISGNILKGLAVSNDFKGRLSKIIIVEYPDDAKSIVKSIPSSTLGFVSQPMYQETLSSDDDSQVEDTSHTTTIWSNVQADWTDDDTEPVITEISLGADGSGQGLLYSLNNALGLYSNEAQSQLNGQTDTVAAVEAALQEEQNNLSKSWIVPVALTIIGFCVYHYFKHKKK